MLAHDWGKSESYSEYPYCKYCHKAKHLSKPRNLNTRLLVYLCGKSITFSQWLSICAYALRLHACRSNFLYGFVCARKAVHGGDKRLLMLWVCPRCFCIVCDVSWRRACNNNGGKFGAGGVRCIFPCAFSRNCGRAGKGVFGWMWQCDGI